MTGRCCAWDVDPAVRPDVCRRPHGSVTDRRRQRGCGVGGRTASSISTPTRYLAPLQEFRRVLRADGFRLSHRAGSAKRGELTWQRIDLHEPFVPIGRRSGHAARHHFFGFGAAIAEGSIAMGAIAAASRRGCWSAAFKKLPFSEVLLRRRAARSSKLMAVGAPSARPRDGRRAQRSNVGARPVELPVSFTRNFSRPIPACGSATWRRSPAIRCTSSLSRTKTPCRGSRRSRTPRINEGSHQLSCICRRDRSCDSRGAPPVAGRVPHAARAGDSRRNLNRRPCRVGAKTLFVKDVFSRSAAARQFRVLLSRPRRRCGLRSRVSPRSSTIPRACAPVTASICSPFQAAGTGGIRRRSGKRGPQPSRNAIADQRAARGREHRPSPVRIGTRASSSPEGRTLTYRDEVVDLRRGATWKP